MAMTNQQVQDAGSDAVGEWGSVVACCDGTASCSRCGGTGYRSICNKTVCHEYGCYDGSCSAPTPPQENDR